jgi:excisionase family DNA binding protein
MSKLADEIAELREENVELRQRISAQDERIAALEEIIASRLGVLPPALANGTVAHKDAAFDLGVNESRISQLIRSGRLRAVRVGGCTRIDKQSLEDERRRRTLRSAG